MVAYVVLLHSIALLMLVTSVSTMFPDDDTSLPALIMIPTKHVIWWQSEILDLAYSEFLDHLYFFMVFCYLISYHIK